MTTDMKWGRNAPLKSRWYDDHFGNDVSAREIVENRVRALDEQAMQFEEDVRSREVERFFDLFDQDTGTREPQS